MVYDWSIKIIIILLILIEDSSVLHIFHLSKVELNTVLSETKMVFFISIKTVFPIQILYLKLISREN
jgi:hypothetical protein